MADGETLFRAVYRNRGLGRQDAVYVIVAVEVDDKRFNARNIEIYGLYGKWEQYDTMAAYYGLRGGDKPKAIFARGMRNSVQAKLTELCLERDNKGYVLQPQFSFPGEFYLPGYTAQAQDTGVVVSKVIEATTPAAAPERPARFDVSRAEFLEL